MSQFFRTTPLSETELKLLKIVEFANFHSSRFESPGSQNEYVEITYEAVCRTAAEFTENDHQTLRESCRDEILNYAHNKLKNDLETYGYLNHSDDRLYRTSSSLQHGGDDGAFSQACLTVFHVLDAECNSRRPSPHINAR